MKLLLIDTKPSLVVFRDCNKFVNVVRKTYVTYGRIYFTYNKSRIYLSEFIIQQDGTEIYCSR